MKYLSTFIGYLLIILAAFMGAVHFNPRYLIFVALASTLTFAARRRKDLIKTPMAPDQNMFLDGLFLFCLQGLLMFTAYLIGYFLSSPGGDLFVNFLTGQR